MDSSQSDHQRVAYLRERIIALGPWHLEVQVTPDISTGAFLEALDGDASQPDPPVTFISPRDQWIGLMKHIYPGGLDGRTILDCACNCGGYSFWAKELGASRFRLRCAGALDRPGKLLGRAPKLAERWSPFRGPGSL